MMAKVVMMLMIWMQKLLNMTEDEKAHDGGDREERFGPTGNDFLRLVGPNVVSLGNRCGPRWRPQD